MRDQAARLVAQLCARFSDAYYNMQPRISRTLLKALLDKSKPLTTHYGAQPVPCSWPADPQPSSVSDILANVRSGLSPPGLPNFGNFFNEGIS